MCAARGFSNELEDYHVLSNHILLDGFIPISYVVTWPFTNAIYIRSYITMRTSIPTLPPNVTT